MDPEKYQEVLEEVSKLKEEIKDKNIEISKLQETVLNQQLQLNLLNRYFFGSKKENIKKDEENIVDGEQCSLFGTPEDVKEEVEEKTEEITVYRKKKNKKKASGIKKATLKNTEIITNEYKLNDIQSVCPVCGGNLELIGKELERQEIEFIPAKLLVRNYVRYVYKCEDCGTDKSEKETPTIVKAKMPKALLNHSFVSPSLAAEVIYQKYYMGAPLYRQEKMWDDLGLVLPRNMMANWCIKISEYYLEPLYQLMLKKLKEKCDVIHMDETTIQVNKEDGRNPSSKSYMWVLTSGENETRKGVIFHYSKTRKEDVAKDLLSGYENILVTDRIFRI